MPYLIVGIDPGSTIGVAALGLDGKPVHAAHIENGGLNAAVALIESWGTPSLIATDVRPAPEMARRLAASFNALLFVPAHPWREDDKREAMRQLRQDFSFSNENAHERDALSAAVQAWRANQNVLRSARIADARMEPREKERLMHLLLNGYRHEFALEMLKEENDERGKTRARESAQRDEGRDPDAPKPGQVDSQKRALSIVESRDQRLALGRANAELRKRISLLENERDELAGRIRLLENGVRSKLAGEMQYRRMSQRIGMLEKRVEYEQGLSRHLYKKLAQVGMPMHAARPACSKNKGGNQEDTNRRFGADCAQRLDSSSLSGRQTEGGTKIVRVFPPALANEANLKGLDSSVLESLIRQYRRSRAGAFDKER